MSLPTRQQRRLDRIERKLIASDPVLHSWFAIFTRLTRDEEMPRIEEVRDRLARFGSWLARFGSWLARFGSWLARFGSWLSRRTFPVRRRMPHLSTRARAILFFPAALAVMVVTLLVGASGPAMQRCATSVRMPATELVVKARQCRLNFQLVHAPLFGH